jgi:hypothetical protein
VFGSSLHPAHQIGFGDNADELARTVHDGNRANNQKFGNIANGIVFTHGDHGRNHHISCFHWDLPRDGERSFAISLARLAA